MPTVTALWASLLLLLSLHLAGAHALPVPADPTASGEAPLAHGRRLEQAPVTLPACKTQLTTSQTQLATCKSQLNSTAVASKACTTKLTACAQSATAKQLSACQRRGAAYNSATASTAAKLSSCTAAKAALAKENSKLKAAAAAQVKRGAPTVAAAATPDTLPACQQQLTALQAQVDGMNASLAGAQAALAATQAELDSVNTALAQRDADVAASCHAELSNQGAKVEDAEAEMEAWQQSAQVCEGEKASLQDAYKEASAKQFPPEEYVACANQLITLEIESKQNADAAGECQSQLADVERSYQECVSRNRRLLNLPGGQPELARTTA
ncbi:ATPase involved in DNA repair [Chlorella sorokiniana]|uniref:ATPase involved in DNA repair n=1 Tax=Chlorella sorokiniana TaxID=3076 RepID=A0A2P6U3U5_CHLSO|nr:ATPase involved in DNA repair [Chlorella sorokiniana]|eukprot:PRW60990.1 ATPase involved in DNA repair [Chlorella sorokiniana]